MNPPSRATRVSPTAAAMSWTSAGRYARRTDSGASCRVYRFPVARWASSQAPTTDPGHLAQQVRRLLRLEVVQDERAVGDVDAGVREGQLAASARELEGQVGSRPDTLPSDVQHLLALVSGRHREREPLPSGSLDERDGDVRRAGADVQQTHAGDRGARGQEPRDRHQRQPRPAQPPIDAREVSQVAREDGMIQGSIHELRGPGEPLHRACRRTRRCRPRSLSPPPLPQRVPDAAADEHDDGDPEGDLEGIHESILRASRSARPHGPCPIAPAPIGCRGRWPTASVRRC